MISINYRDPRPIYEQLKDSIRKLVLTGTFRTDERLPSVRELSIQLAINPNTIQRAYRELEAEGFLYTVPGKGSFAAPLSEVEDGRRQELLLEFDAVVSELSHLGMTWEMLEQRFRGGEGLQ